MELLLRRSDLGVDATLGELSVDGAHAAYTLEPPIRKDKPCAIPVGTYKVVIQYSPRFQRNTPHLVDVPGFTFIEIHVGNKLADTEGCILVGASVGPGRDWISNSNPTFNELMTKLSAAESISLTVL